MAPSAAVSAIADFIKELRKIKRARCIEHRAADLDAQEAAAKNGWAVLHEQIGDPADDIWPDAVATGYLYYMELIGSLHKKAWDRAEEKAKGARQVAKWKLGRALIAMGSDCNREIRGECRQVAAVYCDKLYARYGTWSYESL